jgi:general secretion pathway protein I
MKTSSRSSHREAGSVLVEAMVAVAVIAMMLAVTYRAVGESVLRSRAAEASRTAAMIAQSRLAMVGAEIPLAAGDTSGVDGDFTWRVSIEPAPQDASTMGVLLSVRASVRRRADAADRAVLTTQRMAPVA